LIEIRYILEKTAFSLEKFKISLEILTFLYEVLRISAVHKNGR